MNGNRPRLEFPVNVGRSDVLLEGNFKDLGDDPQINVAAGGGGSIAITTRNLNLNRSFINAGIGDGLGTVDSQAGDIEINATGAIALVGSAIANNVGGASTGQGGSIRISTGSLSLTNLPVLTTRTSGRGDAGDILIEARDAVSFDDLADVSSTVDVIGIGRGGNIRIRTGSLSLTNSAQLNARTAGRGNAGDILIEARDTVSFDGTTPNGEFPSGAFSTVEPGAIGAGGDITVIAADLAITDGAELNASSAGRGRAGDIQVNVPQVRLDQGDITAETRSGDGGNVNFTVPNTLLLRRGSSISTTAGTAQAGGNGGNIQFNGGFVVAVPSENSNITANAFTGRGGSVDITAQAIFGFDLSSRLTPQSDITASSQFGTQGTIALNTPDVDPTQGLTELPTDVTDASRQIAQTCPTGDATANPANEFIVTGRGGLPPTPDEAVNQDAIQVELVTADAEGGLSLQNPNQNRSSRFSEVPIVEAQGWQVGADGRVILVAAAPESAIDPSATLLLHCH